MVIIQSTGNDGTHYHYGPFTNQEHAVGWAEGSLQGFQYVVVELHRPGSTFITCKPSDILDFIATSIDEAGESYVTVDGVNWAVQPE